jgi:broad specificity phosphatase PhoE
LIRHAESEENRRLASLQSVVRSVWTLSWPSSADVAAAFELANVPGQVDSAVSARGREQIADVRSQLEAGNFVERRGIDLILHSPLQRARDTCLGLFPPAPPSESPCRVEETDLLLEKTPVEWILSSSFHGRLQDFVSFVQSRPESRIVAVGHSQFFRAMLQLGFKFDNCDVWHVELSPTPPPPPTSSSLPTIATWSTFLSSAMTTVTRRTSSTDPDWKSLNDDGESNHSVPPPWSNLQRLMTCKSIIPSSSTGSDHDSNPKDKDA